MYLLEVLLVRDESAKYFTFPGQVTKASPLRVLYHQFLKMVL